MTPQERSSHIREHANSFPPGSIARACLHQAAGYIDLTATELSPEMRRLVIAARVVAFEGAGREAIAELGEASEAFAALVPWDDAPSTGSNQISASMSQEKTGLTPIAIHAAIWEVLTAWRHGMSDEVKDALARKMADKLAAIQES